MFRMLLFFVVFLTASPAFAHNADQLPFVQVDGLDAKVYPVPSTSLSDFPLPQDLAVKTHLPGELVTVEIVSQNLPILPEYIAQTRWHWDFGDGTSADGLKAQHTYSKAGSYLIDLHSTTGSDTSQLLDRIQINVLPVAGYVLPKAVIAIDSKIPTNPYTDILDSTYGYAAHFDGSSSVGEGLHYFWDFGDTSTAKVAVVDHTFRPPYLYVSALLRVTDTNGLIADQFAQLQGLDKAGAPSLPSASLPQKSTFPWKALSLTIGGLLVVGIIMVTKRR